MTTISRSALRCGSIAQKCTSACNTSCAFLINTNKTTLNTTNNNINNYHSKRYNQFSFLDDDNDDMDMGYNNPPRRNGGGNSYGNSYGNRNGGGRGKQQSYSFLNGDDDFNDFGGGFNDNSYGSPVNRGRMNYDNRGGGMNGGKRFAKQQIMWSEENLTPFRKDFYKEHPSVSDMSDTDVQQLRENANMIVFGDNIPKPFKTFKESGIPEIALAHLDKLGISEPSAIQQQGIPMALSGRDIVGISRTGSGKTLAYLLPAIIHIQAQPVVQRGEGPIGLVLAPTRELAIQIDNEIRKYVESNSHIQLKHCAVFGGSDRHKQIRELRQSPDLLVATPGRLLDLLQCGETNFKRCTYLVLDEADRMLDMGFRDDLETILSYVRPDRQVLMWSATWPKEIQAIANTYMTDPIRVQIGSTDLHANQDIHQTFRYMPNPRMKFQQFMKDVQEIVSSGKKTLVFANTKRGSDELERQLMENNVRARAIHGDKSQASRENILSQFRNNRIQVLIATDVVARGIDIRDIEVVLVFDMPNNLEDYVHRIGRTARAGDKGISLSYVTDDDAGRLGKRLIGLLKKSNQAVPKWLQQASF